MGGTESQLPSNIFMEMASETRCEILKMLYEKPTHATKIAIALKLTKQEAYRNTTRLVQVGLVKKNVDGLFSLTEYGTAVTNQFSFFLFFEKHKKFFENHSLKSLPQKFVARLGELENTELITSVANVLERLKQIESGAKEYRKSIFTQGFKELGQITLNSLMNKVTIKGLVSKQSVIPDELYQWFGKQILKLSSLKNNLELRQIEKFGVAVDITEGPCAVFFPNKNEQVNMNSMFVGNNESVRVWCNDVFDYYWRSSKPFKNKFLKIQVD